MNEHLETAETSAPTAPAIDAFGSSEPAAAAPASPSPPIDSDLERFLLQYENEVGGARSDEGNPETSAPEAANEAMRQAQAAYDRAVASGAPVNEMRQQLIHQGQALQALYRHTYEQRDQRDFENVVSKAEAALKEAGVAAVPGDYAKTWIMNEVLTNGELRRVLDHRYDSDESRAQADRAVRRMTQEFIKQAKSQPDAEATANYEAVAAAVRGASGKAPPDAPKRYGQMDDNQFRAELAKFGVAF